MPEVLKQWLEQLSKKDADDLFIYLDGDPAALDEMLEILQDKVS